jgi:hypothetical protein
MVTGFREIDSSDAQSFFFYGVPTMVGALVGGYRAVFARTRRQLSPAGLLEQQKHEAQSKIADARLGRWYVRYPVGIVLFVGIWELVFHSSVWAGEFKQDLVWYIVCGLAFWMTREVSKWLTSDDNRRVTHRLHTKPGYTM